MGYYTDASDGAWQKIKEFDMELELVKMNDGRYTIDLGNDCEIEITVETNGVGNGCDVGVEIKSPNDIVGSCSASANELGTTQV
jgi:hypothetical protein